MVCMWTMNTWWPVLNKIFWIDFFILFNTYLCRKSDYYISIYTPMVKRFSDGATSFESNCHSHKDWAGQCYRLHWVQKVWIQQDVHFWNQFLLSIRRKSSKAIKVIKLTIKKYCEYRDGKFRSVMDLVFISSYLSRIERNRKQLSKHNRLSNSWLNINFLICILDERM